MKIVKFSKKTIIENTKNNKIKAGGIFLLCILIGILIGVYQYWSYTPHRIIINIDYIKPVVVDEYPLDDRQIKNIFTDIKNNSDCIYIYYQYLLRIPTSEENRLKIEADAERYYSFYNDEVQAFQNDYFNKPTFAEGYGEETIKTYQEMSAGFKRSADEEKERIKDVMEGPYTDEYKESVQSKGELQIAKLNALSKTYKEMSDRLSRMSNAEIENNRERYYKEADEVAVRLLEEGEKLDALLRTISKTENYELIYNKYLLPNDPYIEIDQVILSDRLGEAVVYAKSIEGTDIKSERFWASVLFFTLFGVVVAVLFGALYEKKPNRENL